MSTSLRLTLPFLLAAWPALAADPPAVSPPDTKPAAPDAIDVYFEVGSAHIRQQDLAELDHAARLYRDGKPILMTVAGSADASGSPQTNLRLSQERAFAVFQGLVARGIPAARFQILAKGVTDPVVPDNANDSHNRRAEITWK